MECLSKRNHKGELEEEGMAPTECVKGRRNKRKMRVRIEKILVSAPHRMTGLLKGEIEEEATEAATMEQEAEEEESVVAEE